MISLLQAPQGHGRIGEDLAHRYLRRHGCTVVARNHRTRSGSGQIDLAVWHGTALAFIEMKTRRNAEFGAPEGASGIENAIAFCAPRAIMSAAPMSPGSRSALT